MWDGRHYRCSGCGEIYCESMDVCPCCSARCVALEQEDSTLDVVLEESASSGRPDALVSDVLEGLTDDQRAVVEIDAGRHLVLAPPGTGKTEMLTRRVVRALAAGRSVKRMFCGTFTIRAAVEMRDRISAVTKLPREFLPEIGNLHHFCYAFLSQHHFIPRERQIVDEVFVRDVVDDCIMEFKEEHGVKELTAEGFVLRLPGETGVPCDGLSQDVIDACKGYLNLCDESSQDRKPVVIKVITDMEGMRQRLAGIPERLCEPQSPDKKQNAFVADILNRYTLAKKRLSVIDFDDLLIETYARLASGVLPENEKYDWIQVDEVQDLNPLQWEIVDMVAAPNAVLVYFGDYDQSIFSFMGASLSVLDEKARSSIVHSFKKNFRATSYLLDMLTRYSFKVLESRFPFVPSPNVYENAGGALALSSYEVEVVYTLTRSGATVVDYRSTRALLRNMMLNSAVGHVYEFLKSGSSGRVAVLVQTNKDADAITESLMSQGIPGVVRFSGEEFSHSAAYRNAAALFESVSNPISRPAWSRLFYLFGGDAAVPTQRRARELAMSIFETGMNPSSLFQDGFAGMTESQINWIRDNAKFVTSFRDRFSQYRKEFLVRIGGKCSIRDEMSRFRDHVDCVNNAQEGTPLDRLEHFFEWTDEHYKNDQRPFVELLANDWLDLSRMKEADMLTEKDRVVVSTVHKAKGLQFDTVIIPDADGYPSYYAGRTQSGREESSRLLYVALSRAKRQLILMRGVAVDNQGRPSPEFSGRAEFIDPILEAFAASFADFYYKKDCLNISLDEIGKTDWLAIQYKVAEAVRNRRTLEDVDDLINHPLPSIRRMAVLTLEWEEDVPRRTMLLKNVLAGNDFKAMTNAVYVIGKVHCVEALKELRGLMTRLGPDQHALKLEILAAYDAMPDSPKIRELIGDSVYDVDGGIRRESVRILRERGEVRWDGAVLGDHGDWDRMAGISDMTHNQILSWMIGRRCPFVCEEACAMLKKRLSVAPNGGL